MKWLGRQPVDEGDAETRPLGFDDYDLKLGDIMRGERATLGKSLLDVQRELHIRATYIAAIENGDLSVFDSPSFVAGFVRSYAKYLKLDPEWAYETFCRETGFSVAQVMIKPGRDKTEVKVADKPVPEGLLTRVTISPPEPLWRRVEPGALGSVLVLLVLIAGLGYGAWALLQEIQRVQLAPVDQSPSVLVDLDPLGSVTSTPDADAAFELASPGSRERSTSVERSITGGEGSVRVYRPQGLDLPVMESRDGPIASITPRTGVERADNDASDSISRALAEALEGLDQPTQVQVTADGPPSVELLAVRPSWVRVRAADGTTLFEKILDAGERFAIPQSEAPPTLRAGNSGSVYFMVDGQAYGPAAPGAQVVSNVELSPEMLRERFEVADLSRDADLERIIALAEANED